MPSNDRFRNHLGSPVLQSLDAGAVAKNFDDLADRATLDLAYSYLVRTNGNALDNTAMVVLLGNSAHVVNEYQPGGTADAPQFTVDPDGITLRVGRPRPNWLKKLATDPRPKYTLPAVHKG